MSTLNRLQGINADENVEDNLKVKEKFVTTLGSNLCAPMKAKAKGREVQPDRSLGKVMLLPKTSPCGVLLYVLVQPGTSRNASDLCTRRTRTTGRTNSFSRHLTTMRTFSLISMTWMQKNFLKTFFSFEM